MLKTQSLLRKVVTSVTPAVSTAPPDYMPSASFMYAKVRRPGQKEHFIKVAAELELFKDIYGLEALSRLKINDEVWKVLMEMGWDERFIYLMNLMGSRKERDSEKGEKELNGDLISEHNMKLWRDGNMVYARNFHSLVDIYGANFRTKIDNFYGRNIMKQDDQICNFIVDCRFLRDFSVKTQAFYTNQMQSLHDENWISDRPFSIDFVNYQADEQLVSIAKRNLLFQYGPSSKSGSFQRHPFAPGMTSRRVESVQKKEKLLYISPRATQFVPDTLPPEIQGVVICLSNDASPATSSQSACINDRVQPFQIPFKRVISSPHFRPHFVQLWQYAKIFRHYFSGAPIDESIRQNMDNLLKKPAITTSVNDKDDKQEVFRSAMYQINNCSNEKKDDYRENRGDQEKKKKRNERIFAPSSTSTSSTSAKPPRIHHRNHT